MPEDQDRMDPASRQDKPAQDQGGEKTLTEKEEDEAGGRNKNTPGPVYDV